MKQKTTVARRNRPAVVRPKSLAKSFVNIGIPVIEETPITGPCRGISARLIEQGNKPAFRPKTDAQIKL